MKFVLNISFLGAFIYDNYMLLDLNEVDNLNLILLSNAQVSLNYYRE